MAKIEELIPKERLQYQVYIGLSIVVVGLTGIIYFSDNLLFQRFIGRINPLILLFNYHLPLIYLLHHRTLAQGDPQIL
jgi:hypothetical protein